MELWGSAAQPCPTNANFNINNVLDFAADAKWCDDPAGGSQNNPDYTFVNLMPSGALVAGGNCATKSADGSWNHGGGRYAPDPQHQGNVTAKDEVPYWIAEGFGGTAKPCTYDLATHSCPTNDGVRLPLYQSANPSQGGNLGQNIAAGFYCGGTQSVTGTSCDPSVNPSGTYFFAKNSPGYQDTCDDDFGRAYNLGCREAPVLTWLDAEATNNPGTTWTNATNGNAPVRVQIARVLNFRFYCSHDGRGLCTQPPPNTVPGVSGNANSRVYGRFVAPFVPGQCDTCTGGPSLTGNWAGLDS